MKASIIKVSNYWRFTYHIPTNSNGLTARNKHYLFFDGALHEYIRTQRSIERSQKAYEKLKQINLRLLSAPELKFIRHLQSKTDLLLTTRQYGYLTGILERQNGN